MAIDSVSGSSPSRVEAARAEQVAQQEAETRRRQDAAANSQAQAQAAQQSSSRGSVNVTA